MNAHSQGFVVMADDDDAQLRESLEIKRRLEAALVMIDDRIESLRRAMELKKKLLDIDLPGQMGKPKSRQRNAMRPRDIAMLARDIIREAGRPMTRSELTEAMESRGVPLVGRDRVKNLGTILWRQQDLFDHVEGRGYWPKGDDLPKK